MPFCPVNNPGRGNVADRRKNFLQAVLQDAEDQLRVLAFLLRHAQQHAPVRPGILGERGVGLVRGVLRGVLLAERFVDEMCIRDSLSTW